MAFEGRDCTGVLAPAYMSFFTASVSFVIFLVASVGNLLVCLAVYKDPNKQLRTPFNMFVVNLACADLIVGFVVAPISVVTYMKIGLTGELFEERSTTVLHIACFISCMASVLSLAALTIDRHIAITSPLYYRATTNTWKVVSASLAIWIVSASVPFVYFKVGYISYVFVFANTATGLTLVILVVSYAFIFRKMRQNAVQLQTMIDEVAAARLTHEREARLTKAFMLMLAAFLSCHIPICAMTNVLAFCTTCSCGSLLWLRHLNFLFLILNSCLNPFVYAWDIPCFQKAILTIIGRRPPELQVRLNLPLTGNNAIHPARRLTSTTNPTSPPLQLVTRKEQSKNFTKVLNQQDTAQENEFKRSLGKSVTEERMEVS